MPMTMERKVMIETGRRWWRGEQGGGRCSLFQRSMGRKALEEDWRKKADADDDGKAMMEIDGRW